jgi:peptidoglycan/xylan/chitin deacetylase (PgdA/CDA1 family)
MAVERTHPTSRQPRPAPLGSRAGRARVPAALIAFALVIAACGSTALPAPSTNISPSPVATVGTPSASASAPASSTAAPSPTPVPSPTPLRYVVRAGDTLTSIARANRTTARSVAYWNRVTYPSLDPEAPDYAPNKIVVGWTLIVWPGQVVDEQNPPPGPSPSPRPSLTLPPAPTPRPDEVSLVIDHGPRESNAVALTFDMGGRLDPALAITDWLIAHDVPATVFPTGKTATTTTVGKDVLVRVAAHPDLFTLGNHTWDHPDLTELDAAAIEDQLSRTESAVEAAIGRSTKPFMRPPNGAQDLETRQVAGRLGFAYTIMWDVDTIDWKPESEGGPTADDMVARVLARAQGGSIVLMHLGGYNTLAALPRIVDGLRERGLEPVTLARMFGID